MLRERRRWTTVKHDRKTSSTKYLSDTADTHSYIERFTLNFPILIRDRKKRKTDMSKTNASRLKTLRASQSFTLIRDCDYAKVVAYLYTRHNSDNLTEDRVSLITLLKMKHWFFSTVNVCNNLLSSSSSSSTKKSCKGFRFGLLRVFRSCCILDDTLALIWAEKDKDARHEVRRKACHES